MKKIVFLIQKEIRVMAKAILRNRITLAIFILSICLYYFNLFTHNKRIKELESVYTENIFQKETEFKKVVDNLTQEVSYQQKVIEYERDITRRIQDEAIKKISKELKIETKNIREVIKLKYNISNEGEIKYVIIDSTKEVGYPQYTFNWSDSFLVAKVVANKDKGFLEYTYTDSLRLAGFVKRKGLFGLGKQEYFIDAKFANQNVKMLGMQSVNFNKVPAPRYSIGVGVGYYYIPTTNRFEPGIGISIHRNLFSIR